MDIHNSEVENVISRALLEDLKIGDITSELLIPEGMMGTARIIGKSNGVVAGIEVTREVFNCVDSSLKFEALVFDGQDLRQGDIVATVEGLIISILKGERTALNFLQRLSGIATQTALFVKAVEGLSTRILDTRKTTPGLRSLEKHAVKMGGGDNHRHHLGDGILIKDNHLAALCHRDINLKQAVMKAKRNAGHHKVEVEVTTIAEAIEAVEVGVDVVMLDNMSTEAMQQVVEKVHGKVLLEASGGVDLDNIRSIAETGVDFISVGALTHSAKALDFGLDLESHPTLD